MSNISGTVDNSFLNRRRKIDVHNQDVSGIKFQSYAHRPYLKTVEVVRGCSSKCAELQQRIKWVRTPVAL